MAPRIEVIAAVAANGVIGRGGTLPWHLPDDLSHFKTLTMGKAIVMGRRTFESIGRALPGRRNVVVSGAVEAVGGIEVFPSLDAAIAAINAPVACVIGGAALYAAALPRAEVLHLTELELPVEGDVFFPDYPKSDWRLTADTFHPIDARHAMAFHFRTYQRVINPSAPL